MVLIRRACEEDAVSMATILREIGWSRRRNSLPLEEVVEPIRKVLEMALKDSEGHSVYVAESRGEILGFVCTHWVPFIMLGGVEGYISDLFVSPSHSGLGVGSKLIETVFEEGRKRDAYRLMVTNGKNRPSYKRGFYRKMGFEERPTVANFVYYYKEPWS